MTPSHSPNQLVSCSNQMRKGRSAKSTKSKDSRNSSKSDYNKKTKPKSSFSFERVIQNQLKEARKKSIVKTM